MSTTKETRRASIRASIASGDGGIDLASCDEATREILKDFDFDKNDTTADAVSVPLAARWSSSDLDASIHKGTVARPNARRALESMLSAWRSETFTATVLCDLLSQPQLKCRTKALVGVTSCSLLDAKAVMYLIIHSRAARPGQKVTDS